MVDACPRFFNLPNFDALCTMNTWSDSNIEVWYATLVPPAQDLAAYSSVSADEWSSLDAMVKVVYLFTNETYFTWSLSSSFGSAANNTGSK